LSRASPVVESTPDRGLIAGEVESAPQQDSSRCSLCRGEWDGMGRPRS
jgi:hypothetical protein